MKRLALLLVLMLGGCSPLADILDRCKPGTLPPGPYHGGVCGAPAPSGPATAFAAPTDAEVVATAGAPVAAGKAEPLPPVDAKTAGWRRPDVTTPPTAAPARVP